MMKLQSTLAVAIAAATLLPLPSAFAGATISQPVSVDFTTNFASGSLRTAHDSSDSKQSISCNLSAGSSANSIQCTAQDASGASITCTDSAPQTSSMLMVSGISSSSWISFHWDKNKKCTSYQVYNSSLWM